MLNDAIAEIASRFLKKGSYVYINGQLETRSYEKDGEKKFVTEVVLRPYHGELGMLDKAPERPAAQPSQQRRAMAKPAR